MFVSFPFRSLLTCTCCWWNLRDSSDNSDTTAVFGRMAPELRCRWSPSGSPPPPYWMLSAACCPICCLFEKKQKSSQRRQAATEQLKSTRTYTFSTCGQWSKVTDPRPSPALSAEVIIQKYTRKLIRRNARPGSVCQSCLSCFKRTPVYL